MGKKGEVPERSWSDLPLELLCIVSSHLFVGDFITFRAVCKSWRSSTSLIRQVPPLIDSPHSLCPRLLSVDNHECRFHHPTHCGVDREDIPELYDAHIHFSKYGWLLLTRNHGTNIFFFNLFTKEKVELPKPEKGYRFLTMCFSSPPTSSDCFVLGVFFGSRFGFIRRGDKRWTYRNLIGRNFYFPTSTPVLYRRLCYCFDDKGNLVVFDPTADPSILTVYAPKTTLPNGVPDSVVANYLVESDDGKLYVVFMVTKNGLRIYVFEVSVSDLSAWHRVRNLGNRTMYLSMGASFLEAAVARETSNKIYLPIILGNLNVFYSLSTSRLQPFPRDYSDKNSYRSQAPYKACWIRGMPNGASDQILEW